MRLDHYMRMSSPDEDSSSFRSLKIGVVKDSVCYDPIVQRLSERYDYIQESFDLVDEMNRVFRSICKGMYKFKYRLCMDEDIHLSDIKIDSLSRKKVQLFQHEINDKLTKIKSRFEKDLNDL
jgi:hypothetical protein